VSGGKEITVLGIDPGTASTGYGVVHLRGQRLVALDGGVISTHAKEPVELRLASLSAELGTLIDAHRPAAIAVEEIFLSRNTRSAFAVGQARGAALALAGARGVPCFSYTPQAVKLAVCGSGSGQAGKDQVKRMVTALLALERPPATDHTADALAVAICHAHRAMAGGVQAAAL
jgi:crossover junction endodeoxyribonuclease RuvC